MSVELLHVPSRGGVTIALHHHGGDGAPVVFCHATGFHARIWDPIIDHVREHHDCWAIDFRGHGDSTLPGGAELEWSNMAADLLVCVDAIRRRRGDPTEVLLGVGHSMGGAAIAMAELERPGTFARAFLFEPILFPPMTENLERRNGMADGARRRRHRFASRDAAIERYASRPPLDRFDPRSLRAYVEHGFRDVDGGVELKCAGATEAAVFDRSDNRAWLRLDEIATVTLVVGGHDDGGPAGIVGDVAARLGNGTAHVEDSLTHFGPMEQPDRFAAMILEHLDGVEVETTPGAGSR